MTSNYLLTVSVILLTSLCISCGKDKPDCGCESDVTTTIPDSSFPTGIIRYKKQLDPNDTYYLNTYWITYVEPNCGNCGHSMIVCNEAFLVGFEDLRGSRDVDTVKFAGQLRKLCTQTVHPADYTYEHITLTKIEKL
jgi:hypothetical protein